MRTILLLAAVLVGFTSPSIAADPPQAAVSIPAIDIGKLKSGPFRADAMAFAEATMPAKPFDDMLIAMTDKGFRQGLGDTAAKLNQASPGIVDEMSQAIRTATMAARANMYRDTLERYARLYSQVFTPAETAELAAFYRGPAGQRLISAKYATISSVEIDFKENTTASEIRHLDDRASREALDKMEGLEVIELMKLGLTPTFRKLTALMPTANELEASMANEDGSDLEKAVGSAIAAVIERRGFGD